MPTFLSIRGIAFFDGVLGALGFNQVQFGFSFSGGGASWPFGAEIFCLSSTENSK